MVDAPDDRDRGGKSGADWFDLECAYDREEFAADLRELATAFEDGRPVRLDSDDRVASIILPQRVTVAVGAARDPTATPSLAKLELDLEWDDVEGSSIQIADRDATDETAEADEPTVIDVTAETAAVEQSDAGETDRTSEAGRTSRFEVYEDNAGEWRWRLVHWNGNIVADSGEGYVSRSNAERAARSVIRSASTATIERRD
ncbi:amphi-Trp domain-containing protein [Natrinema gelatinilyticum]|uniref:amphi-Trp domain-containing protein n=1 Tax=Natrinema gelatinilyticum TaxID=2961571 RepID=UPI0020C3C092|nr:amphi-Trp domain-containing protein [Natrinema gelatinilyticum]